MVFQDLFYYVNHDVWIILNSHKKYHLVTLKSAKIEISFNSFCSLGCKLGWRFLAVVMSHVSELWMNSAFSTIVLLTNQNGGFFSLFRKKYKRFLFYNFEILEGELFLLCKKVLESVTLNSRAEEISLPTFRDPEKRKLLNWKYR